MYLFFSICFFLKHLDITQGSDRIQICANIFNFIRVILLTWSDDDNRNKHSEYTDHQSVTRPKYMLRENDGQPQSTIHFVNNACVYADTEKNSLRSYLFPNLMFLQCTFEESLSQIVVQYAQCHG